MAGQNYGLQRRLPMTRREYDYKMAALASQPIPGAAYVSPMVKGGDRLPASREMMDAYYGKPGFEDVSSPLTFRSKNLAWKNRLAAAYRERYGLGINRRRGRRGRRR